MLVKCLISVFIENPFFILYWSNSSILERLMNKKEKMDININTSVRHRACKKPMKKLKLEFLELVSDEDSSSNYEPDSDSDDDDNDDDE